MSEVHRHVACLPVACRHSLHLQLLCIMIAMVDQQWLTQSIDLRNAEVCNDQIVGRAITGKGREQCDCDSKVLPWLWQMLEFFFAYLGQSS